MGAVISHLQDGLSTIATVLRSIRSLQNQYHSLIDRISSHSALPVSNPTSSYWMQDPPFPELCDIQGDLPVEADVVIIGSGITGAAAAKTICELTASGSDKSNENFTVVVVEARQLCSGATARNGGHIKCVPHEEFSSFKEKLGEERARVVVAMQMSHLDILMQVGDKLPQAEVREVETVDLFLEKHDFDDAKKSVEEFKACFPEFEILVWESEEAREKFGINEHVVGALSYKAGALWPYRLITGIWNDLIKQFPHLVISTHTTVTSISSSSSSKPTQYPYTVHTSRGDIRARHVLHATNGYAGHVIPPLRGQLTGVLGHMTAQRPGKGFHQSHGKRSWSIIYAPGFEYVTQRPDSNDGSPGDLMLGGGFFRSKDDGLDQIGVWDDSRLDTFPLMHLRGSMATVFEPQWGSDGGLKKAWTGIMGFTGDRMPLVGRLPQMKGVPSPLKHDQNGESTSGQWISAGYNGEGMVWAWLSGTAVAIMLLGKEADHLEPATGRPGGTLDEWFPIEETKINAARLKRADLRNLAEDLF